jgi:ribonuclease HI
VLTEYPLRKILQKLDLSGRLVNWAVELEQFDIEFHPRTVIKGQALADFLVEFCNIPESEELPKESTSVVYVDKSLASKRSGVVKLNFLTTNNKAKYEVVIAGLSISREVGATNVEVRSDSQVVVGQVQGEFDTQEVRMARYLEKVRELQSYFYRVVITKIPREANRVADELSKLASRSDREIEASGQEVIVLAEPYIAPKFDVMELDAISA